MPRFFRSVDDQVDRIRRPIGNLPDAIGIEAGPLTVGPEPTEMAVLVDPPRSAVQIGGARHASVMEMRPDLLRAMAARQHNARVLNMPISNAVRHVPESSLSGSLRCETACALRSRSPTEAGTSRPSSCGICSASTRAWPVAIAMAGASATVSGARSAKAGVSPRRAHRGGERRGGPGHAAHLHLSRWRTAIRRRGATFGTHIPERATFR